MKSTVIEAIKNMLSAYDDPDVLIPLLENHDLFGRPFMWYVYHFELNELLNTPIMDKFMVAKWNGRVKYAASLSSYSTPFAIL